MKHKFNVVCQQCAYGSEHESLAGATKAENDHVLETNHTWIHITAAKKAVL